MSDIKERFVTIYKEKIHRKGSERLLEWLEKYDFFHSTGIDKIPLGV